MKGEYRSKKLCSDVCELLQDNLAGAFAEVPRSPFLPTFVKEIEVLKTNHAEQRLSNYVYPKVRLQIAVQMHLDRCIAQRRPDPVKSDSLTLSLYQGRIESKLSSCCIYDKHSVRWTNLLSPFLLSPEPLRMLHYSLCFFFFS